MEKFLHLWDELDELLGLAWHGAVAVRADLSDLLRTVLSALSSAFSWLLARVTPRQV